jgi:hypothetical protein
MNRATRTIVATPGTIFGLSGMSHGLFESLQGNVSTQDLHTISPRGPQSLTRKSELSGKKWDLSTHH